MPATAIDQDASPEEFEKRAELLEKNEDEQIARGAVLVPSRLDHQGDFLRQGTIAQLRDNWSERVDNGDAHPGVMHAIFPEEQMKLVEDRQLQQRETIGSKELPAGTWIQAWKYTDDQLWQLVDDGVLGGFSIGGRAKGRLYEPGEMPDDVSIPDPVQADLDEAGMERDDIMVREITDGRIYETSTVDRPAVPDATHAETKTHLSKASPALTENIVAARMYLEERGHSADDAKRLARFLQEHKQADESGWLGRAKSWLGQGHGDDGQATAPAASETKDGRTLSAANVASAKAVHDAALDLLSRSDIEHGRRRFTDDDTDGFEIGAYGRDTESSAGGPSDADADTKAPTESDAATDSDTETTDMSDAIEETLEEITERLDTIEAQLDDDSGEEAADEEKTADEPEPDDDAPATDEKVDELADVVEQQADLLEQMATAQGVSQQADTGTEASEGKEATWDESPFMTGGEN
ncbi:XkdF-like putative serine protease domain-containing protein [Haloarcula sp. 1CSR25-25]|uniref:XkdF-like putative serine protease domain-containing protein n=1 Tax=Haloarcula sp. 1CSR25-25 TaxID=2862545 RepID=UPI0028943676|nr:XkdF-like putative serine protease domain-containing protein [Haloarcula sp. 1CSR25-25]MDT3434695.1 hypothetical protein [Haloarcula sp. 1CSR25-25]